MSDKPPIKPLIVHLITRLENGGAQRHALYILNGLPRERFRIMLAYGPGGYLDEAAHSIPGLECRAIAGLQRQLGPFGDLAALRELVHFLRPLCQTHSVVLQTHSSKAGILGRIAGRIAGAKAIIHTVHGFGFRAGSTSVSRSLLLAAERSVSPLMDHALCVSYADLDEGAKRGLLRRDQASVIRAGIDVKAHQKDEEAGSAFRRRLNIPAGASLLGTVACLKPQKAPLDFIIACGRVLSEQPDAHFVLVGDGELKDEVDVEIRRWPGLAERMHLLGWSDEIPAILSALDLFVLTSLWEGLPRALLEARAAGLPCVVTDTCGNPEAIQHGLHGLVVPMSRPDKVADACLRLLADRDLYGRMSSAAKEGLDAFDIRHIVPQHVALYERLLEDTAPK
ncbi:MAG: glycosyltransferase [Myxococcota bacterium]|nr:glycosyltransferase [Myxococcota bacterium]